MSTLRIRFFARTGTHLSMNANHKNKTIATFLAAIFGSVGAHRFYLYGRKDRRAWLYVLLFPLSAFAGFIAALMIGLTPDALWDKQHNHQSSRESNSGWLVILMVIGTFGIGTTLLIAVIARVFDLLYTGGAYG
jgi:TM2 domain-containing membrane protein YozV